MGENCQHNRNSSGEKHQSQEQSTSSTNYQGNSRPQPPQSTGRFADYFVICGLDLDTGLEPDRFAGM